MGQSQSVTTLVCEQREVCYNKNAMFGLLHIAGQQRDRVTVGEGCVNIDTNSHTQNAIHTTKHSQVLLIKLPRQSAI